MRLARIGPVSDIDFTQVYINTKKNTADSLEEFLAPMAKFRSQLLRPLNNGLPFEGVHARGEEVPIPIEGLSGGSLFALLILRPLLAAVVMAMLKQGSNVNKG